MPPVEVIRSMLYRYFSRAACLLAESTAAGGLYLLILFALCFGAVAGAKALRRALQAKKTPPPPPAREEPAKEKPKAVYYLVEKKRTTQKASYKQPRKINFDGHSQSSHRRMLSPSPQSRSR